MQIACVVVLYYPEETQLKHLSKLLSIFDYLIVFDNSPFSFSRAYASNIVGPNLIYISQGVNQGIAYALNHAVKLAIDKKMDYLCTLDQDSVYPVGDHPNIVSLLADSNKEKDVIVSLSINHEHEAEGEISEVQLIQTSGNFINLPLAEKNQLVFNEDLFIDSVDYDFDYQAFKKGLIIKRINHYWLIHTYGSPTKIRFLWKTSITFNYSPARDYYIYRNIYYLWLMDKRFFRKEKNYFYGTSLFKIIVFEKNKMAKIAMIKQAKKDAKAKRLGKRDFATPI